MSLREIKAHKLAELIMRSQARELAHAVKNGNWHDYYDPLAATCLGDLIYIVMSGRKEESLRLERMK